MELLEKITEYFKLMCGILFVCCCCLACGEKHSQPPAEEVSETFIKPSETSSMPNNNFYDLKHSPNPSKQLPEPPGLNHVPLLVNPDFTVEELPYGEIKFTKKRLRIDHRIRKNYQKMKGRTVEIPEQMVNRAPKENIRLPEEGKSIMWLSSYALYAMELDSCELWAYYYLYGDWSVESYSLAETEYPNVLVGVSMAHLFTYNRILKVNMETGRLDGYFELPENLAGIYVLHSLGNDRYFAVSYQGDDSWRMSLLNLGDKPIVEKAIILRDLGLPSGRGYNSFSDDDKVFFLNNRGLFITVDVEKLEIIKRQEVKDIQVKQIDFVSDLNQLCAFSLKSLTLFDPQSFKALQFFELPMQPAVMDYVHGKNREVFLKKGELTYLSPSGLTYRALSDELIITFDESPNMLLINCHTKSQRFIEFAKVSTAIGQPVYLDEEHLLIGGKYVYNFKTGETIQIIGAENSGVLRSLIYF